MIKVAINGFGRIGRLFFRFAFKWPEIDIVAINDLGDVDNLAYLLRNDSVYRHYPGDVKVEKSEKESYLIVDGKKIRFFQEKDPVNLPWKDLGIDVALESTGFFESYEKANAHILAGAKRVVISAPAKGKSEISGRTVLLGVNDGELKECQISSNGSCTTNACHPVVAILNETIGIQKALLNTIHSYTATQRIVDGPDAKDWRRGRAGAQNIIPSSTGAAISVTEGVKELKGLFDGIAIRVPSITGSIADITFLAKRKTTVEEINDIFRKAAQDPRWKGILRVSEESIVSSDIIGDPHGAIIDLEFTKVVDGDLVKVLSWYDNEWGYSNILAEHVIKAGKLVEK